MCQCEDEPVCRAMVHFRQWPNSQGDGIDIDDPGDALEQQCELLSGHIEQLWRRDEHACDLDGVGRMAPPTVAITSPRNNAVVTTNVVTIKGTASDKVGVAQVVVQVNNGQVIAATGLNSWSAQVTLPTIGVNTITAQSLDVPGNFSSVATIKINYEPVAAAMARNAGEVEKRRPRPAWRDV